MSSKGTAIVFGGAGFLGSHVADTLTQDGYQVRIFDIRQSPYLKPGQEGIVGDLMNLEDVRKAMQGCDYVYNFAGIADIGEANVQPLDTAKINVIGTVHTLEGARMAKVKRYVFASTVYVYSNQGSFYRTSKQAAERFIETYGECYGLSYTILRYGSLYGRRADRRNGIYRLLSQALIDRKISYVGSGEELREYIHVGDAARTSVDILASEYANQHIIIAGNEKMRSRDLVKMVAEMLGGIPYEFSGEQLDGHYQITPYAFNPKIGKKLVSTLHTDLGQGLIDCMADIDQQANRKYHGEMDWLLKNGE